MMKREPGARTTDWRRAMGRELGWLLAVKFAALVCLWLLFFSPGHRQPADVKRGRRRLRIPLRLNGGNLHSLVFACDISGLIAQHDDGQGASESKAGRYRHRAFGDLDISTSDMDYCCCAM